MGTERRKDYVDLTKLVKDGAINKNDIKHMKETLDEIKDGIKEFLSMYAKDKEAVVEDRAKLDKTAFKLGLSLAPMSSTNS